MNLSKGFRDDRGVKNIAASIAQSKASRRKILSSVKGNAQSAPRLTKPAPIYTSSLKPDEHGRKQLSLAPRTSSNGRRTSIAQKKPKIPATDSKKISILWQEVMDKKYSQPTQASRGKAKSPGSASLGRGRQTESGASETTYPPSGRTTSATSARIAGITIDNSAFRDLILLPRNISIDSEPLSRPAFQHFNTIQPTRYQDIDSLATTTVWLEGDDRFKSNIVAQYKEMKEWGLCEAEYAQYALEHLLKSEVRDPDMPPNRAWKTKRMIQLVAKPGSRLWNPPPLIDATTPLARDYNFDVRPDCSYWIPIDVFNDDYRYLVVELAFAKYKKIVCPYLSVEFKKDDSKEEKAENQVAIAASIALYNRFKLKEKRLRKRNKVWTEKHLANVRHYGITFRAEEFTVWCIRPKTPRDIQDKEMWMGCVMESVFRNDCMTLKGVQNLMDWINEIHRWGMTVHGDSCQRDIQHCIEADNLGRTSLGNIQPLQDSGTDPGLELEPVPALLGDNTA